MGSNQTKSTSATSIVNNAMAYALDQCIFTCTSKVDASSTVNASKLCGCGELGIAPGSAACATYQLNVQNFHAKCTQQLQANPPKNTTQLQSMICACSPTSGCNVGVTQNNSTMSQQTCKNNATVTNDLSSNFANDVVDSIKSTMSDIGGLFDGNSQSAVKAVANQISQNVTTQHISTIQNMVDSAQKVTAGCGGLNFGVTQMNRYTNILNVLQTTNDYNKLSGKINNTLETDMSKVNNGFLGWLNGNMYTAIIVAAIIGVVILVFFYFGYKKHTTGQFFPKAAAVATPEPAALVHHGGGVEQHEHDL